MKKYLFLAVLFLSSNLKADPCCCAGYGLQGEFLYWALGSLQAFNTQQGNNGGNSYTFTMPRNYDPAFRIDAIYQSPARNLLLEGRFTYYDATNTFSKALSNVSFPGAFFRSGDFSSKVRVRYYTGELTNAWQINGCECYLLGGVQYVWSGFSQRLRGVGVGNDSVPLSAENLQRTDAWQLGPQIGFTFLYPFCSLAVKGNFRVATLFDSQTQDNSKPVLRVTPIVDFKMGLSWLPCLSCLNLNVEVGYEFVSNNNFTFDGPYASLGICF